MVAECPTIRLILEIRNQCMKLVKPHTFQENTQENEQRAVDLNVTDQRPRPKV